MGGERKEWRKNILLNGMTMHGREFLEMNSHCPSDVRLLIQGAKGFRDAWHLDSLHEEDKIMKRGEYQNHL